MVQSCARCIAEVPGTLTPPAYPLPLSTLPHRRARTAAADAKASPSASFPPAAASAPDGGGGALHRSDEHTVTPTTFPVVAGVDSRAKARGVSPCRMGPTTALSATAAAVHPATAVDVHRRSTPAQ